MADRNASRAALAQTRHVITRVPASTAARPLVLGVVGPALAAASAAAGAAALPAYTILARAPEDAVSVAISQVLGTIELGVFFIGVGSLLRPEHRSLGTLTILLGSLAFIVFLGRVAGPEAIAIVAILLLLPLMTLWFGWVAFSGLRAESDLTLAAGGSR